MIHGVQNSCDTNHSKLNLTKTRHPQLFLDFGVSIPSEIQRSNVFSFVVLFFTEQFVLHIYFLLALFGDSRAFSKHIPYAKRSSH